MKIVKVKTREYKNKIYHRFRIDLPEDKLLIAEFKAGDDLDIEARKGEIKLRKIEPK